MQYKFTIYSIYNECQFFKDEAEVAQFLKENRWLTLSLTFKNKIQKRESVIKRRVLEDGSTEVYYDYIEKTVSDGNKYICLDDKGLSYTNSYFYPFIKQTNKEQRISRERNMWYYMRGTKNRTKTRSLKEARGSSSQRIASNTVKEYEDVEIPEVRNKKKIVPTNCFWEDFYFFDIRNHKNKTRSWKKYRKHQYK